MRSLVLLCALVVAVIVVCKPAKRLVELPAVAPTSRGAAEILHVETVVAAPKAPLLSLLTLGAALVGVVSATPTDNDASVAMRIAERTAELEASGARVADQRRSVQ